MSRSPDGAQHEPQRAAEAGVGPKRVGEGGLLREVVKRLRRKLGDDAAGPSHIIAKPRVRYRMVAGETPSQQSGVK